MAWEGRKTSGVILLGFVVLTCLWTAGAAAETLEVILKGNGSGRLFSTPHGIDCPGKCSHDFPSQSKVALFASSGQGSLFAGWSGPCETGVPLLGWERQTALPTPQALMGQAVAGPDIHLIGGIDDSRQVQGSHSIYRSATGGWTEAAPLGTPRFYHCTAETQGQVLVIGGARDRWMTTVASVEVYDSATDSWLPRSPIPALSGIRNAGCAAVNGRVYLIGGFDGDSQWQDSVRIYDVAADSWSAVEGIPVAGPGVAAGLGTDIYFLVQGSGESWRFDTLTGLWSQLPHRPIPCGASEVSGIAAVGESLYAVTWPYITGCAVSVLAYDPAGDAWSEVATAGEPPAARMWPTFSTAGGALYLFGGMGLDRTMTSLADKGAFIGDDACVVTMSENRVIDAVFFPADADAPVSVLSSSPAPSASGWFMGEVAITLTASDGEGGSGVKEVHYALSGALSGGGVVEGPEARVTLSAEGETTVTFFSVDGAGNRETPKSHVVRIDRTPPSIDISADPAVLWPANGRLVPVTISGSASDSGSGVATKRFTVIDEYGKLTPTLTDFGAVIRLQASRRGDDGDGRTYTVAVTVVDRAGNTATKTTIITCPHDRQSR